MAFNASDFLSRCSFCGLDRSQVSALIVGPEVSICDTCVDQCVEIIRDQQSQGAFSIDDPPTR